MTAPNVGMPSGAAGVSSSLHRILTPDEFHQARQMSPEALDTAPFPVTPPSQPRQLAGPSLAPTESTRTGPEKNPQAQHLTGLPRILTQYVAQPIMDHPLTTAMTALLPGAGYVMGGLMAKDVAEYGAQKLAELQLPPDVRKLAEADPSRIPGEQAAVEAVMLGAAPLLHGTRKLAGSADAVGSLADAAHGKADAIRASALDERPATTLDPAKAAEVENAIQLGNAKRAARTAMVAHSEDVANAVDQIAPSDATKQIIRANAGASAAVKEQAFFKLDEFRRAIDPLPYADQLGFVDAIQGGESQPSPEFQMAADAMRDALEKQYERASPFGLDHYIQDYFPQEWKDPGRASTAFAAADQVRAAGASRAPFEGSKTGLQERTIPSTLDGVRLGLEPKFTNPADVFAYRFSDMERFITAHRSLNDMVDNGLARQFPAGESGPDGWIPIQDKIARTSIQNADGTSTAATYWAPKDAANVINNYLSPGLASVLQNKIPGPNGVRAAMLYNAYRGLGNVLNMAQLGLSAFHLGFTTMDATVSRVSLGLEHIAAGRPLQALGEIASAPAAGLLPLADGIVSSVDHAFGTSFGENMKLSVGAKIRDAYRNPEAATPEFRALAEAVELANGRVGQDATYRNSAPEKMLTAWRQQEPFKAAAYSFPALFEKAASPIMDHIVPLQKLSIFGDMARVAMDNLPPEATLADRRAVYQKAWDSVDNRMGQLVYDNLFWNKTFKDLAMASTRSVGWNLGTIRELGGGLADLPKLVHGELTHRSAYVMALPMTVGMMGATYQYLRTGEGPSELKDYFYPKTGEVDADGNPERVQMPSYMKDVMAYTGSPFGTVKHKVAPLLATMVEMLQNQDYFGDQIRNADDPIVKQVAQEAEFFGKQFLPFSLTNMSEQSKRGDQSLATKMGNWFGVTPAPRSTVRTDAQNKIAEFQAQRQTSGATPEQADAMQTRREVLGALRGGAGNDDVTQKIADAIDRHQLTPPDVAKLLKRAGMTPAQEKFKGLTLDQALQVFKLANPTEQAKFGELLVKKVEKAAKVKAAMSAPDDGGEMPQAP